MKVKIANLGEVWTRFALTMKVKIGNTMEIGNTLT